MAGGRRPDLRYVARMRSTQRVVEHERDDHNLSAPDRAHDGKRELELENSDPGACHGRSAAYRRRT